MNIGNIITINRRLIAAINSCDQMSQMRVIDDIMTMSEDDVKKVFSKKYFFWNICRGKDFYKVMARYVCESISNGNIENGIIVLRNTVVTAKSDDIRRAFVRAILKKVPILTLETIAFATHSKLSMILAMEADSLRAIVTENMMKPFIDRIIELEESNEVLTALVDGL